MSHISFSYHLIFATYRRVPSINFEHERELYKFLYDFFVSRDTFVRRIGGMPDHVHILCDIPPKFAVADIVKVVKSESSKFMRVNPHFPIWSGWTEGYGGFTVTPENRNPIKSYIENQREHHLTMNFMSEYKAILRKNGLSVDDNIFPE